jgi:hypothetical protein
MKDFLIKNKLNIISILPFIGVFIYIYFGMKDREKYFDNGKTLYTIGEVVHYKDQGKIGSSIGYTFFLDGIMIESADDPRDPLKNSIYKEFGYDYKKMRQFIIGKKFFIKYSVEKPRYTQIYLSKPVAEDFQYTEGQTWETIPKEAVENKDIYGNER